LANLVRLYLERAGYTVTIVGSAVDALRVARKEKPDLVTLDVMLPDQDGFSVLSELKRDDQMRGIPVVMLSMMPDEGKGKLLGAVDYLEKPVSERVLLDTMARVLTDGQRRSVLVAEDDADTRRLLAHLLGKAGYQVIEAADGLEAVSLARRHMPGLVLMDIKMPRMDGVTALRALREDSTTRDIAIVMMTVSPGAMEENRRYVEDIGVAGLIRKPCTASELAAAIARGFAGGEA